MRQIFDEELEPKIVQQRAITAPELMTYFEVYVHMFQKGNKSFPQVGRFRSLSVLIKSSIDLSSDENRIGCDRIGYLFPLKKSPRK